MVVPLSDVASEKIVHHKVVKHGHVRCKNALWEACFGEQGFDQRSHDLVKALEDVSDKA